MAVVARGERGGRGVAATARVGQWTVLAVAGLALLGGLSFPTHGPATPAPLWADLATPAPNGCGGVVGTAGVHGQLTIDGGPLAGTAPGAVALNYTYSDAYKTYYYSNGTKISVGCSLFYGNTTTAPNGSFAFVPVLPNDTCESTPAGEVCTEYIAPQFPVHVGLPAGPPAGYVVSVEGVMSVIAVALVYELSSVTITPDGPSVTTAVGAPTTFTATVWAANDTPTVLDPTLSWAVNGTGWSLDGPASGGSVTVVAVGTAGVGMVSVRAAATDDGVALAPVTASVNVVAVATAIEAGSANRTGVDVGSLLEFGFSAVGAAGFAYTAYVEPGLGLSPEPTPCSAGTVAEGTETLTCSTSLAYATPGTAQPTANITNGYSSATWRFPDVTVAPAPELEVTPTAPVGYAQDAVPLTVRVANGTGTGPYARACLAPGSGIPVCVDSAGPAWTFAPTYPSPGTFSATAWAVDADGSNASLAFSVTVVAPLALTPVLSDRPNATVGDSVTLSSNVSGGAVPFRYWWNASGTSGPLLDGELYADGPVSVTVVPNVSGPIDLTLTVVDRLGTVMTSTLLLVVGPATADRVVAVLAPPAGAVEVGTSVGVAWEALDVSGAVDRTFAAAAVLSLTAADGPPTAWVNASGVGPLASLGGGRYGVPAAAWVGGGLNVTVTIVTATEVVVGLSGAALPGPVPSLNLSVAPDLANVRLSDPSVAEPGARANATLWRVTDPYGNPAPGAVLTIGLAFGDLHDDRVVTAVPIPGGASGVWINFSALSSGSGELTVTDAAGAVVLGPLAVPPAPGAPVAIPPVDAVATAVPLSAVGVAAFVVARRHRRRRGAVPAEEELARLAAGRAKAVELIARSGAIDLAGLEAAWDPPPAPPELADWLASLVADGTVGAKLGEDGRARFCLAPGAHPAPRPTMDAEALARSLQRRDEALAEGPDAAGDGDGPIG